MAETGITTKDIVLELNRKVDGLVKDMADVKVLAATVAAQTVRAEDHENRLRALEEWQAEEKGEKRFRRWLPAAAGAVLGGLWWLPGHIG